MSEEVQTFRATNGRVTGVIGLVMSRRSPCCSSSASPRRGRAGVLGCAFVARARLGGSAPAAGLGGHPGAADVDPRRGGDHPAGLHRHGRCPSLPAGPLGRRQVHLPGHQPVPAQDRAQRDEVAGRLPDPGTRPQGGDSRLPCRPRSRGPREWTTPTSWRPRSCTWPTPTGPAAGSRHGPRRSTSSAPRSYAGGPGSRSARWPCSGGVPRRAAGALTQMPAAALMSSRRASSRAAAEIRAASTPASGSTGTTTSR